MVSAGDNINLHSTSLRGFITNLEDNLQTELELLLQAYPSQGINERQNGLNIYRYGSAPPTVEASLSALGGILGDSGVGDGNKRASNMNPTACENDILSHPAYLSYTIHLRMSTRDCLLLSCPRRTGGQCKDFKLVHPPWEEWRISGIIHLWKMGTVHPCSQFNLGIPDFQYINLRMI
ncbi:hypothetical protein SAY87_019319 [Trapa incisa]|uniref:Uncharacterized protein n=1 Tax=Trapa incisa TaxID=236973 RepID=A0AAN7K5J8_9MYRT|nr:hypothetical protein SAY87_019319 [Trapa incisa]